MDKVKINRNNYEEYLLLYVDDELSATDKVQVDTFLLKNSDLAEELEMLLEAKLSDDQMPVFKHKESLYKTTATKINAENCEDWFLLYTDNELDTTEKEAIDQWVAKHPVYKQHLELLLATRVPKEEVVFQNKAALYHKEPVKMVSFSPLRWAAAVLVLLTGAWLLWNANTPSDQQVADSTPDKSQQILPSTDMAGNTSDVIKSNENAAVAQETLPGLSPGITTAKNEVIKKSITLPEQAVIVKENKIDDAIVTNNQDEPYDIASTNDDMVISQNDNIVASNNLSDAEMNDAINAVVNSALAEKVQTVTDNDVAMITQASKSGHYNVLQTADESNNFYIGALNLNKNKVKGLLRRAGKVFNDKTRNIAAANGDIIKTTSGSIKK